LYAEDRRDENSEVNCVAWFDTLDMVGDRGRGGARAGLAQQVQCPLSLRGCCCCRCCE
jgi:hypothetical protein